MDNSGVSFVELFMKKNGLDLQEVVELYILFMEELASEIIELKSSVKMQDFIKAQQVAHNLKGICSNYLAMKVYTIAEYIDLQLKKGIYEDLQYQIQELAEEFLCFKKEFEEAVIK